MISLLYAYSYRERVRGVLDRRKRSEKFFFLIEIEIENMRTCKYRSMCFVREEKK